MVDESRPVKCRAACAQTFFAISDWRRSGQECCKVEGLVWVPQMKPEERVAQPGRRAAAGSRRWPDEIDWGAHGHPEMRVEIVPDAWTQCVNLTVGVSGPPKLQVGGDAALLGGGLGHLLGRGKT